MPMRLKPTSVILGKLGLEPNGKTQSFFTQTCAKHMDKYVPMNEGNLRQYRIEGNYIIYEQPYARYQYYGMREDGTHFVHNYTTPGTGTYWNKRMVSAEMQDVVEEVQKYINRGG